MVGGKSSYRMIRSCSPGIACRGCDQWRVSSQGASRHCGVCQGLGALRSLCLDPRLSAPSDLSALLEILQGAQSQVLVLLEQKGASSRREPSRSPRREVREGSPRREVIRPSAERPEAERLVLAPAEAKRRPVEPAYPPPRWEGGKEKGKGKRKVKGKSPKGKGEGAWPKRSKGVKRRSRQERWWAEGGPGYERARERSRSPRSSEVEEVKEDTAAQEECEEEEFRALDLLGDRRPKWRRRSSGTWSWRRQRKCFPASGGRLPWKGSRRLRPGPGKDARLRS